MRITIETGTHAARRSAGPPIHPRWVGAPTSRHHERPIKFGQVVRWAGTDEVDRGRVISAGPHSPNQLVTVRWASGYTSSLHPASRLQPIRVFPERVLAAACARYHREPIPAK